MRALTRPLVAGTLAAGALLATTPADAACVGTDEIMFVCVIGPEVYPSEISQCVYAGGDTCEDVTVPFVGVRGSASVRCGGNLYSMLAPGSISPSLRC